MNWYKKSQNTDGAEIKDFAVGDFLQYLFNGEIYEVEIEAEGNVGYDLKIVGNNNQGNQEMPKFHTMWVSRDDLVKQNPLSSYEILVPHGWLDRWIDGHFTPPEYKDTVEAHSIFHAARIFGVKFKEYCEKYSKEQSHPFYYHLSISGLAEEFLKSGLIREIMPQHITMKEFEEEI